MPGSNPVVTFASEGQAAAISYGVPLPAAHTGRRLLKLDGTVAEDEWSAEAFTRGRDVLEELGVGTGASGFQVDAGRFASALGRVFYGRFSLPATSPAATPQPAKIEVAAARTEVPSNFAEMSAALVSDRKTVALPGRSWAGTFRPIEIDPATQGKPILMIVEVYGISSFLGDYGLGRTIKTFSLFPGEETKISVKTWRSSRQAITEGSSIIDSHQQSASDRFSDKIQSETTDKATRNSKESWHAEAEASASWGFGSAKVSGGAAGEYQAGREEFARQANEALSEHAAEASAKREMSVTSQSERTEETGEESLVERTIKNANMRRTLNFAFRELNQQYVTKVHLKEIRLAFTNGRLDSYREVPVSGMLKILSEVLRPEAVNGVASKLLDAISIVFDASDAPVPVLELTELSADGQTISTRAAARVGGSFPPPTQQLYYRFKRGPLGVQDANPVAGVVLKTNSIVMRTDSVIVEALLGQADALDAYAMEVQEAAAAAKTLANRREELLQSTLSAIADPTDRAKLMAAMLATAPAQGAVPVLATLPAKLP